MGHDICIKNPAGSTVATTYISFNFSDASDEAGGIHAMHGHRSETVVAIAQRAIDAYTVLGYEEPVPDGGSWGWGVGDPPFSTTKRRGIYVYHMRRFQDMARQHPGCRWYSDQVFEIRPWDDSEGEEDRNEDAIEGEEDRNKDAIEGEEDRNKDTIEGICASGVVGVMKPEGAVTFIRHRGTNFRVHSYATAMRAYVSVLEDTGSHDVAARWLTLAKSYPDAPGSLMSF